MRFHRHFFIVIIGLLFSHHALALDPVYSNLFGTAIKGYDPVAYFEQGEPQKGSRDYTYEWNGATWHFSSQENQNRFAKDPEAFAPQYGGYCAWAVSQGYTAGIDPQAWKIVDGKLYLNYSHSIQQRWQQDTHSNIRKGDKNWPRLLASD